MASIRPSVHLSGCPTVNFGPGKIYTATRTDFLSWSVDTLGDWFFPVLEPGLHDILCGFNRAKFIFPMHFSGNKIYLLFKGFL